MVITKFLYGNDCRSYKNSGMEKLIILKWFLKCLQMRKKCYQNGYIQILKKQQQNIPNSDVMKSEL